MDTPTVHTSGALSRATISMMRVVPSLAAALLLACVGGGAAFAPHGLLQLKPACGHVAMCAPAAPEEGRGGGGKSGARGRARGGGGGRARGGGGGRGRGRGGGAMRTVRYITESEMETEVRAAALAQGFEETQAAMLGSCGRNIYAIGCEYHPTTGTMLQELCQEPAKSGEAWALVLLRCVDGQMPRLRSNDAARVRIEAARAAAARKRATSS